MEALKKFKVLGINTDVTKCECCGKENLKKTVAILDRDHEVINYFGVNCAAAVDKYDTLKAAAEAKKEINAAVKSHAEQIKSWGRHLWKILKNEFGATVSREGGLTIKINCTQEQYDRNWAAYLATENKNKFKPLR